MEHLPGGGRGAVAVAVGEPAALGHVLALAEAGHFEDLAQGLGAAPPERRQVLFVEQVADHHETVAAEDPDRAFHFVGFADFDPLDAVVALQMGAKSLHVRVVVDALTGCAWVGDSESGPTTRKGIALFVHGLVDGRVFIPADGGVAVDFESLEFLEYQRRFGHAAPLAASQPPIIFESSRSRIERGVFAETSHDSKHVCGVVSK